MRELITRKGSDLHICVGKPPLGRLSDGFLHPLREKPLQKMEVETMLTRVTKTDNVLMRLLEKEEIDITYECESGRYRVNIALSRGTAFAVFRELKSDIPTPQMLGVADEFLKAVESASYGLVLIVGTTGSGKSTTLASVMNHILKREPVRVITIEDPIEYIIGSEVNDAVSQREVGRDTLSFASALRAAMREDPDYIIVGEVRDIETARNAIVAAETGHIVFVTVHAKSSTAAVDRFCGVFPIEEQKMVRRRLTDNMIASQTQVLCPSVDGAKRYLATELLLVNNENIKDSLFDGDINSVRDKMVRGECGWTLNQSLKNLYDKGLISMDVYDSYAFKESILKIPRSL